jgi:hypothetical protein
LAVQQQPDRLDQETVVLRSDESADRDDDRNLARVIQPGVRRGFLREPPDARQVDRIRDHRRPAERAADLHPIAQIRAHSFANRVNPGRTRIEQSRRMRHQPHLQLAGLLDPTLVAHDRVLTDDQLSRGPAIHQPARAARLAIDGIVMSRSGRSVRKKRAIASGANADRRASSRTSTTHPRA